MEIDKYQERYIAHQRRKAEVMRQILEERHSTRVFSDKNVPDEVLRDLLSTVSLCPSSCDRKTITYKIITDRDNKALLGGLLVGGVGWVHRAPTIILLYSDWSAYKERLDYMPFLDLGVVIGNLYLKTESLGLKCCYINPQVRKENESFFRERFCNDENLIYGGALAIGYDKAL